MLPLADKQQRPLTIRIVPACDDHIAPIAQNMRQSDRREVMAAVHMEPYEALHHSLHHSSFAMTALYDDAPALMFGVGDINILTGHGAPWLLGTDKVEQHWMHFARGSQIWCEHICSHYAFLQNYVDARNHLSIRWLKWLGFSFGETAIFNGQTFYLFSKTNEVIPCAH